MKTACIYHSIDLDGWCSAAIIKHWYIKTNSQQRIMDINDDTLKLILPELAKDEDILVFIGFTHGQPIPDLSEYDRVIMCDISFPKEEMEKLYDRLNIKFIWIDHHISSIKDNIHFNHIVNGKDVSKFIYEGLRDTNFAACELTWKYFFPKKEMPELVRLLGRYDSFGHKGTEEEQSVVEFQYGARSNISNYNECFDVLTDNIYYGNDVIKNILDDGQSIYRFLCVDAKFSYKYGFPIKLYNNTLKENTIFGEFNFICINKERFNPDNFGIDYGKDGYEGVACYYYDGSDYNFSFYSNNENVDCSAIAKQFGGGGHQGAAGAKLSHLQFIKLITNN